MAIREGVRFWRQGPRVLRVDRWRGPRARRTRRRPATQRRVGGRKGAARRRPRARPDPPRARASRGDNDGCRKRRPRRHVRRRRLRVAAQEEEAVREATVSVDSTEARDTIRELLETVSDALGLDGGRGRRARGGRDDRRRARGRRHGAVHRPRGQTIDVVQHLAQRIVFRGRPSELRIVIDAAGYRDRPGDGAAPPGRRGRRRGAARTGARSRSTPWWRASASSSTSTCASAATSRRTARATSPTGVSSFSGGRRGSTRPFHVVLTVNTWRMSALDPFDRGSSSG